MSGEPEYEYRESGATLSSVLVVTAHRPAEVVEPVKRMSVRSQILSFDASAGPLDRTVTAARETRNAVRMHDPDLLFLDCFETIGAPATFIAQQHDIPVISRLVGNPWRKLEEERLKPARTQRDVRLYARHRLSKQLNDYIYSNTDGFIAVSSQLTTAIESHTNCPQNRIGIVPVPLTTDVRKEGSKTRAKEAFDITETRIILTVTNLKFQAKRQGVETIVSEIRSLLRANEDTAYVIAGGGPQLESFRNWLDEVIDDPSLRARIYVLGFVENVADLYALADVFVYVSSLDGYPNVVLEAQTAGLPVIANDAHGMRDQITDGESGLLIDPTERGMLRDRVAFLLESENERRRIGKNACERAKTENSLDAVSRQLSIVLTRLFDEIVQ